MNDIFKPEWFRCRDAQCRVRKSTYLWAMVPWEQIAGNYVVYMSRHPQGQQIIACSDCHFANLLEQLEEKTSL